MATKQPRTTTEAIQKRAAAEYKQAHAKVLSRINDPIGAHCERADATKLDEEAQAALATPDPLPVVCGGGEAILTRYPDQADDRVADWCVDTLQTPDLVKATASLERLRLLMEVGCVELAHDVAETIQPRNSLERLLAGQLASAHLASLKLLTLGLDYAARTTQWKQADAVEACRLVNASARLMSVFQEGLLALAKLRTGGTQTVIVQHQHVYVNAGGQAVVAGDVTTGGARTVGGVSANGGTTSCTATSKPHGRPHVVGRKRGKGKPAKAQ
jgi:hypothetical protein